MTVRKSGLTSTVAGVSAVWLVLAIMVGWLAEPNDSQRCNATFACLSANEWGDYFAGAFAPLAFFWLVAAVYIQSQELSEQRKELHLTRKEMSQQREVMESQAAESRRQAELLAQQTGILRDNRKRYEDDSLFDASVSLIANRLRQYNNAWQIQIIQVDGTPDRSSSTVFRIGDREYEHLDDPLVIARTTQILRTQVRGVKNKQPNVTGFFATYPYDLVRIGDAITTGSNLIRSLPQSYAIRAETLELNELTEHIGFILELVRNKPSISDSIVATNII